MPIPKDSEGAHSKATPHFDGKRDRIIKDSFGTQMGVHLGKTKSHPYDASRVRNKKTKPTEH